MPENAEVRHARHVGHGETHFSLEIASLHGHFAGLAERDHLIGNFRIEAIRGIVDVADRFDDDRHDLPSEVSVIATGGAAIARADNVAYHAQLSSPPRRPVGAAAGRLSGLAVIVFKPLGVHRVEAVLFVDRLTQRQAPAVLALFQEVVEAACADHIAQHAIDARALRDRHLGLGDGARAGKVDR